MLFTYTGLLRLCMARGASKYTRSAKRISKSRLVRHLQALPIFIRDKCGLAQQDAQAPHQEGQRKDGPFVLPARRANSHPDIPYAAFPKLRWPCCSVLCNSLELKKALQVQSRSPTRWVLSWKSFCRPPSLSRTEFQFFISRCYKRRYHHAHIVKCEFSG